MYTKEELQYLSVTEKFQTELVELKKQIQEHQDHIQELVNREIVLDSLIKGTAKVEPEAAPAPKTPINRRKEKTEGNNDERAKLDEALVKLLEANDGLSRKEINDALSKKGWSPWDVDKSIKRCKRRDLIVREGETVNAKWYAAEVS